MTLQGNLYKILGVNRDASLDEIRQAFLSAAKRYHPDANPTPGEYELFLEIKEAYEILSTPEKKEQYDQTLPPEMKKGNYIDCKYTFSRGHFLPVDEPQLIYALMEFSMPEEFKSRNEPALNLCLVLDRSTSMQGKNMGVLKETAIRIMRRIKPRDVFSVIAFNDRAEIMIPATLGSNISKLESRIQMLQPSGGTEIFSGLETGFEETNKNYDHSKVNHIILLTDGQTYGDEEKCITLARQAAERGIRISCLGVGGEWNDNLLDQLAVITGGSSMYVSLSGDIQQALLEKFNQLGKIYADETKLECEKLEGVEIRYAFRVQPEVDPLVLDRSINLGPILSNSNLKVLFEFLVQPELLEKKDVPFFKGIFTTTILGNSISFENFPIVFSLPVSDKKPSSPPRKILEALSHIRLYKLQEQAREEAAAGNYEQAAEHLSRLATHLLAQGEQGLAKTVLIEAGNMQKKKSFSKQGGKEIKYGTRALLKAGKLDGVS
jgi:Ca-activated chloride channel homolog